VFSGHTNQFSYKINYAADFLSKIKWSLTPVQPNNKQLTQPEEVNKISGYTPGSKIYLA
jgi:hypothetical protein